MSIADVEQQVAENGLGRSEILAFFRQLPTSDVLASRVMLRAWVEQMEAAGAEVQTDWVDRAFDDLDRYGRLSHEFLVGADTAPVISLDEEKN